MHNPDGEFAESGATVVCPEYRESGLSKDSKAMAQQVRSIDKTRLETVRRGIMPGLKMRELDAAVRLAIRDRSRAYGVACHLRILGTGLRTRTPGRSGSERREYCNLHCANSHHVPSHELTLKPSPPPETYRTPHRPRTTHRYRRRRSRYHATPRPSAAPATARACGWR